MCSLCCVTDKPVFGNVNVSQFPGRAESSLNVRFLVCLLQPVSFNFNHSCTHVAVVLSRQVVHEKTTQLRETHTAFYSCTKHEFKHFLLTHIKFMSIFKNLQGFYFFPPQNKKLSRAHENLG